MDLALTKPAGNLEADVLFGETERLFAVRSLRIRIGFDDRGAVGVQSKIGRAEFALHPLTQVFSVDFQFLMAARAIDEQPDGGDFNQAVDLLKRYERWNFDAIFFKFLIEQHSTVTAMNHFGRHFVAALRARAAWPSGHVSVP